MPLFRVATEPEELDASAEALIDSEGSSHGAGSGHARAGGSIRGGRRSPDRSPSSIYSSPFLVETDVSADINKNTSWFSYPGVWTMYFIIILLTWLLVLATLGCSVATAWVIVNAVHFVVTFYLFHWKKGSPFSEDQGLYDKLTWWEQMDGGLQLTKNRKFMTMVPVLLFLVASISTRRERHASTILFLNTAIVFVLIIAKLPMLHKVRIFGINS